MSNPVNRLITSPQQLAAPVPDAPLELDTKLCTATYVVSSSAIDNDGDILVPEGSLPHLDRYRNNPVVLWNHDRDCIPIAQSVNPVTKQLSWQVDDGKCVKATACFHLMTQESAQCWGLVEAGVLRGASVGYDAVPGKSLRISGKGTKFLEWVPLEWSVVPIPCNPETLLEAIHRNWDGKSLSPTIKKSLMAYVPKSSKVIVSMVRPASYVKVSMPWLLNSPLSPEQMAAAVQSGVLPKTKGYGVCPQCGATVVSRTRGGPNSKDTCANGHVYPAKETKQMPEDVQAEEKAMPPGAQAIIGFTADIEAALANLDSALQSIENEAVLSLFEGVGSALSEQVEALKAGLGEIYPDLEAEESAEEEEAEEVAEEPAEEVKEDDKPEEEEPKAKSLKKSADEYGPHVASIQDASELCKEMGESPNVPKSYRLACKSAATGLASACDYVSKAFSSKKEDGKPEGEKPEEKQDEPAEEEKADEEEVTEEDKKAIKAMLGDLADLRIQLKKATGKVS